MPDFKAAARRAARKYGVREDIFLAMIQQESGFRPNVSSNADAHGIAQFIPSTAKAYGVNLNDGRVTDDLEGAARYLRDNLKRTGGSYAKALSIYNSGRPDAYKDPNFANGQTYNYVRSILGSAGKYKRSGGGGGGSTTSVTTTRTIPGVDNSQERKALLLQYLLSERGKPDALAALAAGLGGLQDTPSRTITDTATARIGANGSAGMAQGKSPLFELFYDPLGGWKNGKPIGAIGNHADHVHVAAGPKTSVALGKLAQKMGLHVGENPAFDPVDPVHTKGSYHYRNRAIDVSGDPKKMAAYAKRVLAMYGIHT